MTHGGHDAKVAAAATQRPEQVLLMVVGRDDDAAVREHDLRGEQIVEGQPEAADQRAVATAQGEARHADAADRARHRREAERIGHCEHVRGARTARNSRRAAVGVDDHVVHAAQVEHDAVAQRATGPVVADARTASGRSASRAARIADWTSAAVRQWTTARGMRPTGFGQIAVATG
jgi:hypothetical protein